MAWQNADGLQVKFGQDYRGLTGVNVVREVNQFGAVKELSLDVDLTKIADATVTFTSDLNNDGTLEGFNSGDCYLPAYASILRVMIFVKVAAAGGTSIKLGTFTQAGAAIDDDGLITATEGVKANLDTIGARTFGNGAYVATTAETASIGSADAYLGITGAGTWTAGKLRIVIEYVCPLPDA
jgi:hypothetical protein